jgi:hypothetical protein
VAEKVAFLGRLAPSFALSEIAVVFGPTKPGAVVAAAVLFGADEIRFSRRCRSRRRRRRRRRRRCRRRDDRGQRRWLIYLFIRKLVGIVVPAVGKGAEVAHGALSTDFPR